MIKKVMSILKLVSRISFFIFFSITLFNVGSFYGQFNNGESFLNFFSEHTITKEEIPYYEIQKDFYNVKVLPNYWFSIFSLWFYFLFDYFVDKENHFITKIKERVKNANIQNKTN